MRSNKSEMAGQQAAHSSRKPKTKTAFRAMISADGYEFFHPLDAPASKEDVVQAAVTMALRQAKKWPPDDRKVIMGAAPYRFVERTLRPFLRSIQGALAGGNPSYTFDFDDDFIAKSLTASVEQLMVLVYGNTRP